MKACQILQEVVGRYVAMGELAVAGEDLAVADGHYRAAERVVKGYGLPDVELRRLDRRLNAKRQEIAEVERRARDKRTPIVSPPPLEVSPPAAPPKEPVGERSKVFVPPSFEAAPLPEFPWPPPPPSATAEIRCEQLRLKTRLTSFGDVDRRLSEALDANGYCERRYYAVPDGFALVTRIEQINDDGTPQRQIAAVEPRGPAP